MSTSKILRVLKNTEETFLGHASSFNLHGSVVQSFSKVKLAPAPILNYHSF